MTVQFKKKYNFTFFLFKVLICLSITSVASADKKSEDAWLGAFIKKELNPTWSLWSEAQLRYDLSETSMQQTLFRFGPLKKISKNHGLGLLFAFIQSDTIKEHRLTFQHTQNYGSFFSIKASHRFRIEFRNLEEQGNASPRLRYLIRLASLKHNNLKPVFWNECFVNTEKEALTGMRHFERNRAFIGLRKKLNNESNVEFGYLNQFTPRKVDDSMEHILFVGVFF